MTLYSYACNFWTWKAPTECILWSSTSGFHESEGVLSSAKDCPCHLEGIYFQGQLVATNISNSPPDCGRFLENINNQNFYFHFYFPFLIILGATCKDLEECILWTWNRSDCNLYSSVSSWYFRENDGAISGTKDCVLWFKTTKHCTAIWIETNYCLNHCQKKIQIIRGQ